MLTIPIKSEDLGHLLFDSSFPKTEFQSNEQKMNKDGVPLWSVSVLLRQPESKKTETVTITVPSLKDPGSVIEPLSVCLFTGLHLMTGKGQQGQWVSFFADGIKTRKIQ